MLNIVVQGFVYKVCIHFVNAEIIAIYRVSGILLNAMVWKIISREIVGTTLAPSPCSLSFVLVVAAPAEKVGSCLLRHFNHLP